jgi:hypothetical protein
VNRRSLGTPSMPHRVLTQDRSDRGAIRRFTYRRSLVSWLIGRPATFGWAIACPWCEWRLAQPQTKTGLWNAYRAHRAEVHP